MPEETENGVPVIIDDPDAFFRIVRTDQNFVHALEFAVPARPVIHQVALAIHNKNQVLPTIVPALLSFELHVRLARAGHGTHRSVSDILHRMAGARGEDECRAGISGGARGRDFAICVRNAAGANPGEEDG